MDQILECKDQGTTSPPSGLGSMTRVSLTDEAAVRLATHGAAIARAEGFPIHGESMERRS